MSSRLETKVMARALRIFQPGAWFHVTARANERKDLFHDDSDRHHFREMIGDNVATNSMANATYLKTVPERLHVTSRSATWADQLSLIRTHQHPPPPKAL